MKNKVIIWPSAMCVNGSSLWVIHGKLNALFKYNLETEKDAEHICSFKDEMLIRESAVSSLICINETLFSIPRWGNHIHKYDLKEKKEKIIPIPDENRFRDKMFFSGGFLYQGKIYCIPEQYPYIVSIDIETEEVNVEYDLGAYLLNDGFKEFLINDAELGTNGEIYAVLSSTNRILVYDIKNRDVKSITIGGKSNRLSGIAIDDEDIYIGVENDKTLIKYDTNIHRIVNQYDVIFDNYAVNKITDRKVLVDSVSDQRYMILRGEVIDNYESERCEVKVDYPYSYSHGIINMTEKVHLYFDRFSYKLKDIGLDGDIDKKGRYIKGILDPLALNISEQAIIMEDTVINLGFWMSNLV